MNAIRRQGNRASGQVERWLNRNVIGMTATSLAGRGLPRMPVAGRKHDYRFSHHERYGKEGDIALRAAEALAGSWFGLPRRPRAASEHREDATGT
jgi:hypothetical protein